MITQRTGEPARPFFFLFFVLPQHASLPQNASISGQGAGDILGRNHCGLFPMVYGSMLCVL
jgi:hypothetical protein